MWKVDESGHAVANGGEVKHGGATGAEKKGNAMWFEDNAHGDGVRCWNFDITGGKGMWIGVAVRENFGSGYGLKGLLYGGPGNLSEGGSLVAGNWGPKLEKGDKIGMRLEVAGDNYNLAFSKNGSGLGVAYDINGWSNPGTPLRPVVSLDSPDQSIVISNAEPCGLEAMDPSSGPPEGITGSWMLDGEECWLSIEAEGPSTWMVAASVGNTMSCRVTEENGVFSAGPVMMTKKMMMTRMMPSPELQALENSINQLVSGITNITRDGDKLVVVAGDRSEKFSVAPGSSPVTKDRIRWMN